MSRKSGRDCHPTEKAAALLQSSSKTKGARPRESKVKRNEKKRKLSSSSSTGESDGLDSDSSVEVVTAMSKKKGKNPAKRNKQSHSTVDTEDSEEDEPDDDEIIEVCHWQTGITVVENGSHNGNDRASDGSDGCCGNKAKKDEHHQPIVPEGINSKKKKARDILTIFTERRTVKFCYSNGKEDVLKGRWCGICREDEEFVEKHGMRRTFHIGSNSSCRQHIRGHYKIYEERCKVKGLGVHHHAVPRNLVKAKSGGQQTLVQAFQNATPKKEFSLENMLKAVSEFVVCDSQGLAVVDKAMFTNCLVSMRPCTVKSDIPTTHDVTMYIHNQFIELFDKIKAKVQDPTTGRISTTTDLWTVGQTKASFMGITTHWIEVDAASKKWSLVSQVIAFCAILGAHNGLNLGKYFVGLCTRAGLISKNDSKLFCIMADNTSNNDTACDGIQDILERRHIYSFNAFEHHLPCLAHIINLAITDVMAEITRIDHIETTSAIWEFDPSLSSNRVLGNSIDVVAAIRTLAIKIQASGQRITYFHCLQKECGISTLLMIPLQNNTCWGTAEGMLARSYELRLPINLFVSSADKHFGPITSIHRTGTLARKIPWTAFKFDGEDWERVHNAHLIISDANGIQQYFSHEKQPTLWRALPAFEELQTAWESKRSLQKFQSFEHAIDRGLEKINKYYGRFDDKPVFVLSLAVHPYYKLVYFKMASEGARDRNTNARDRYDDALKIVEDAMAAYFQEPVEVIPPTNDASDDPEKTARKATIKRSSESAFDRLRQTLVQQSSQSAHVDGWAAELQRYLSDLPADVEKDTDVVKWWEDHANAYPTVARIAKDVCAIPATSVPCERLFSAGSEIATDRRNRLGAERFEQLQVLKHAWQDKIMDQAKLNSTSIEVIPIECYKDYLVWDELVEQDSDIF